MFHCLHKWNDGDTIPIYCRVYTELSKSMQVEELWAQNMKLEKSNTVYN